MIQIVQAESVFETHGYPLFPPHTSTNHRLMYGLLHSKFCKVLNDWRNNLPRDWQNIGHMKGVWGRGGGGERGAENTLFS